MGRKVKSAVDRPPRAPSYFMVGMQRPKSASSLNAFSANLPPSAAPETELAAKIRVTAAVSNFILRNFDRNECDAGRI